MLARTVTRRALHDRRGRPRLPSSARRDNSFRTMLLLAVTAGALLAVGDVVQEQRKRVARSA
jgi:hypothetical protein